MDHTNAEVIYRLVMLVEAGFLAGNTKMTRMGSPGAFQASDVAIFKLTWEGTSFWTTFATPRFGTRPKLASPRPLG
jgi:hypothetical protein